MPTRCLWLLPIVAASAFAAGKPASFVRNGGFEKLGGWNVGGATLADGGNPGRCLRFGGNGAAVQDVLVAGKPLTFTAAVDVKAAAVRPEAGKRGYAFAAVYQTDERGKLVVFRDFAQVTGTTDWRRCHTTFTVDPRAAFISLRCGMFQATGLARFDNWTLVRGTQAKRLGEVAERGRRPNRAGGVAAILNEPTMPVQGAPSSPQTLARILRDAGMATRLLSAEELADPTVLDPSALDLVVIPTGQSFPAVARGTFVHFLRNGGDFISMGGYAFNRLVRQQSGKWASEAEILEARLGRATSKGQSLLPDGGFEASGAVPLGGTALDGAWRRSSALCTIAEQGAREGRRCARVAVPPGVDLPGAQLWLDLPAKPHAAYQVSGWARTRDVAGRGIAFIALYQHDDAGKLVEFRDFAAVRGTTPWRRYTYRFSPGPAVRRIHIKCGLYLAHGTAWFDDIRLGEVTGLSLSPMNTASGTPRDGLAVSPAQIGVFDASFPLKRVRMMRPAPGQHVVGERLEIRRQLAGWAASGVVGYDNARWIPLLQTYDRYDRPRGAAGSLLLHYRGFYEGSCWAYFGVESCDLFADPTGPMARALRRVATFLLTKTFLHNLTTDRRLYRSGEPVKVSVTVDNRGRAAQKATVRFAVKEPGASRLLPATTRAVVVQPDGSQRVEATLGRAGGSAGLCEVVATLSLGGKPIDEMVTGFVVERPEALESGPTLRFAGNYFTLNGRPTFLFGSDTYSTTYKSAHESPSTWSRQLTAARDAGLMVYENLQHNRPGHKLTADDWRDFRAMSQLTQKHGLVFMPGMLIGHDVAVGDDALAEQSQHCENYARQLGGTPGLLYYINGDYRCDLRGGAVKGLWNRWLKARYETTEKLRAAWGHAAAKDPLGSLAFPPHNSGRWDDRAAIDSFRFQKWLTRRWNAAHVAAIRKHDARHPITSEYYSSCWGPFDQRLTIDGQDVANIGYFDRPVADIDNLPLKILWNDLRARGKGVTLGEYGVKTHPAWSVENGATGYHIARTEEQQKQLFTTVAHYALGLGVAKIQNWCLRDAQARVFPWGIFYPNQMIPKDVAYAHRNLSLIWRHFRPTYAPPRLAVCIANGLRLGNHERLGPAVAYRAFADLLALHHQFSVIDDHHLGHLPPQTKAMVLPCPFAMRDDAYARVLAWVRAGGTLLVTGDLSCDAERRRTRTDRLKELAGVEFVAELYPWAHRAAAKDLPAAFTFPGMPAGSLRPCIAVRRAGAEVLGKTSDGEPLLVRHKPGRGVVYLFTDPIELSDDPRAEKARRALYAAFLSAADVQPLRVDPNAPWLHVLAQPTASATVHVVYNRRLEPGTADVRIPTAAGTLTLATRNRWPALAVVTSDARVVALSAYGTASVASQALMRGRGLKALLSLDGADLRTSQAVLVAPFEPGSVELPRRSGPLIAVLGELRDGTWTALERIPLDAQAPALPIDADRATCLILISKPSEANKWGAHLTNAVQHPARIKGY